MTMTPLHHYQIDHYHFLIFVETLHCSVYPTRTPSVHGSQRFFLREPYALRLRVISL